MSEACRALQAVRAVLGTLVMTAMLSVAACGGSETSVGTPTTTRSSTTSPATSDDPSSSSVTTSSSSAVSTSTSTTTAEPQGPMIEVYYSTGDGSDCGEVQPFLRTIADDVDVHRSAFAQLVSGPTPDEVAAGASSFFSSATSDVVISAALNDGLLVVDFTDLRLSIPNASASCGSEALLAQLNSTAFQFDDVERTRYVIEGNCSDFANWLQRECFETNRSGESVDLPVSERAAGSGCTPLSVDTLPAGRWFGYIDTAETEQLTFDLACWFTGEAAAAAATEDGEESPPPNDYYIRNESLRLRVHPVDSATTAEWFLDPGDPATVDAGAYEDWLVVRATRAFQPGVWLTTTDDSHVVRIVEQYVP